MGMLEGKVAVVTGAGRGIGRGMAKLMAREGAKVVVNDLGGAEDGSGSSTSPADEVVSEIVAEGGEAAANYDTVATVRGGQAIIKTAIDNFGKLDILVNNAGIRRDRMIFDMTEDEWDDVIAVHLKGHYCCTRPAAVLFREQKSGRIINMSSAAGLIGIASRANLGAAKAGIAGFTRVVARDLAKYNITVNCIAPSASTRLTATVPDVRRGQRLSDDHPERSPDNIAPLAVYLASDRAQDVTGQVFHVGGYQISLFSHPSPIKTIMKSDRWTVDELMETVPKTIGRDMFLEFQLKEAAE